MSVVEKEQPQNGIISTSSPTAENQALSDLESRINGNPTEKVPAVQSDTSDTPDTSLEWKASRAEWLILACLSLCSFVVALDATILVPVLPVRIREFYFSTTEIYTYIF